VNRLLAAVATAWLAACVAPPTPMRNQFEGAAHDAYIQPGTAVVSGQAIFRKQGGDVVTCARRGVLMFPATPFFDEVLDHLMAGRQPDVGRKLDPRYKSLLRQSRCDAQGNFAFRDLPAGDWHVVTEDFWTVGGNQKRDGLVRRVTVSEGQAQQVLLTEKDRVGR